MVVNDLAERFGVSTVTVRKDLERSQRRSVLRRVRGGAVSSGVTDEGAFETRVRHAARAKQAIARAVAPTVRNGDVIAMDSSTTCYYLALELLERRNLVVVTNGLRTATLFMEQSGAMVLMPGGVLRRSAGSMVGPIGDVLAGRGRIDKGFFGMIGLSVAHGLLDISVEEAHAKQYMARACSQVYRPVRLVEGGPVRAAHLRPDLDDPHPVHRRCGQPADRRRLGRGRGSGAHGADHRQRHGSGRCAAADRRGAMRTPVR